MIAYAVTLAQPTIIEGTQLLVAPELTAGHRRILVDTPLLQIVRQILARERANFRVWLGHAVASHQHPIAVVFVNRKLDHLIGETLTTKLMMRLG